MQRCFSLRIARLFLMGSGLATVMVGGLLACSQDPASAPAPASAPSLTFTTFQPASLVIGQADFTSYASNRAGGEVPAANTLSWPYGKPAVAPTGRLYLPDSQNARVLGYHTVPTTNGAPADFVLGQQNFTTQNAYLPPASNNMGYPTTVLIDQGKLFVMDYSYRRVQIWNTLPTSNNVPADVVVGQPDKTTTAAGCTAAILDNVESMAVIDGKLVVADSMHNRLLIWNSIPTTDGAPADLVLGQPDFTTCTAGATRTTFDWPTDVVKIGAKLVVADQGNHRVLIWNTVPTASGTPPDVVLGQPDFTSNTANTGGLSASSLQDPYYLATDGTRLALSDQGNQRVLIWNTVPTCTPTPCASTTGANVVLGQQDFLSNGPNAPDPASVSAQGFSGPVGLYFNGPNQLFVGDLRNHRVLIFNAHL